MKRNAKMFLEILGIVGIGGFMGSFAGSSDTREPQSTHVKYFSVNDLSSSKDLTKIVVNKGIFTLTELSGTTPPPVDLPRRENLRKPKLQPKRLQR